MTESHIFGTPYTIVHAGRETYFKFLHEKRYVTPLSLLNFNISTTTISSFLFELKISVWWRKSLVPNTIASHRLFVSFFNTYRLSLRNLKLESSKKSVLIVLKQYIQLYKRVQLFSEWYYYPPSKSHKISAERSH